MIYAFIRSYIGGFGRAILDFYIANNFVVNGIILLYALCVYLAHISYLNAYRSILLALGLDLDKILKVKAPLKIDLNNHFKKISWDQVRRSYWFPFLAPPKKIMISLKTNPVLQEMFSLDHIKQMLDQQKTSKAD